MIHPFSGNCTRRSRIGEVWMRESVFRGSGELSLQALNYPTHGALLGSPQKLLCHPLPTLFYSFYAAGGLTHVYCHHHKWGELLGARVRGPSTPPPTLHFSHCSLATLSLELCSSPPSGTVDVLYGGTPFLLWKYLFSFITQLSQSGCGHSEASGCQWVSLFFSCQEVQGETSTLRPLRRGFVWQEAMWWWGVELLIPKF